MPTSTLETHLQTQAGELHRRYDTLTKRIAALDTDIGRELDSERKLVLQERRDDLVAARSRDMDELTEVELRLSSTQSTATQTESGGVVRESRAGKTAPTVIGTNPPNGATNVSRGLGTIHIQFDRPMAPGGGSLSQKGGFGLGNPEVHYDAASRTYSFTRDNPGLLPAKTAITFTVNADVPSGTGFVDLAGNCAEMYKFSFTTGAEPTDKAWAVAQERASLECQLAELRENLRLIEERKTEYVQATDIPLQLVKEERRTRQQIAELENLFNRMK